MSILISQQRLQIARNGSIATPRLTIDAKTERLFLRIGRQTTAGSIIFPSASQLSVFFRLRVDTIDVFCQGRVTGGVRTDLRTGLEASFYGLSYLLPWGFFGANSGFPLRLGENRSVFDVLVEIQLDGSPIDTTLFVESAIADAPLIPFHSSVAFDVGSASAEGAGDGVISYSHVGGSGADRGAFVGSGNSSSESGNLSTSTTYGGQAMTEMWDNGPGGAEYSRSAGYRLANNNVGAGTQTVVNTLAGAVDEHVISTITMTGVHQTTPVGTPVSSVNAGADETSASDTVGSVGSDDLVVDYMYSADDITIVHTQGANQTTRGSAEGGLVGRGSSSTQLGTDGGVMSWTFGTAAYGWAHGAVAFKPSVAAGIQRRPPVRPFPFTPGSFSSPAQRRP